MRLEGEVAIVTGGTSGIGRRMVERFVGEGAVVFFTGRRAALGADLARSTGASFIEADAACEADAKRAIESAASAAGCLDILVNNAGFAPADGRLEDLSLETFDATIAVHLRGALVHMKHASRLMRARKRGSIINIASVAAHRADWSSISYGAAKAGLLHLTQWAAVELGEDNVRVNSISPGGIATGIFAKAQGVEGSAAEQTAAKMEVALAGKQAIARSGQPDDIASAAVFLASDEASFINGADLVVDGGLLRGRRYSDRKAVDDALRAYLT